MQCLHISDAFQILCVVSWTLVKMAICACASDVLSLRPFTQVCVFTITMFEEAS